MAVRSAEELNENARDAAEIEITPDPALAGQPLAVRPMTQPEARNRGLQVLLEGVQGPVQIPVRLPSGSQEVIDLPVWRSLGQKGENSQWTGKLIGQPDSLVVVTRWKGAVFGSVFGREGLSEIAAGAEGQLDILPVSEMDCEAEADEVYHNEAPMVEVDHDGHQTGEEITVVVGYNQQAADSLGGAPAIEAKILTAIQQANEAYQYCGIEMKLGLAWMGPVDYHYPEDQSFEQALADLRSWEDNSLTPLTAIRAEYGADFVSLWLASDVAGGMAQVVKRYTSPDMAVHVVRSQNPTTTFIHELGHNMGCRHSKDMYASEYGSWYPYSYGNVFYGNNQQKYSTVMCSGASELAKDALRTPYFSGPNVFYQGTPTGVPNDTECARTLRNNAKTYAAFLPRAQLSATIEPGGDRNTLVMQYGLVGEEYALNYASGNFDWQDYVADHADTSGRVRVIAPMLSNQTFYQFKNVQ